ncbi:ABC transporter ATP-binding protein [Thermofilum pendens]|uniref:Molybdate/tungstate import ATP-binding protein WtpC n=1 Tax=Thermofilum pendens (strain DSM 2475 / Hrk 5) TaxID=368408 RepID=A1RYN4_THEPD|nr:ABC transporter ATP-binding protein [Thermofilum pendens]ABL78314.1 ABC transporter related [Thermofilum pendens Hrk 5]
MAKGVSLQVVDVWKTYRDRGRTEALRGVTLEVERGELFSILGPSGCGKTTLLRIIAGLSAPDRGKVFFDGVDVTGLPAYERDIGMVFQDLALFPHLTVYKNVAFSLELAGVPREVAERRVREVLELVHLPFEVFAHRKIQQLSGGQQQRVAIARALARDPRLLLLDEPFSHLDYKVRLELIKELKRLQRETGVTTVYVTHDQNEAMMLSDRLALMKDGVVLQVGRPDEVYRKPANAFVASFLGESNLVRLRAVGGVAEFRGARLDLSLLSEEYKGYTGEVTLFVRPEHVSLHPPPHGRYIEVEAVVVDRVFLGPLTKVVLDGLGDAAFEALFPSRDASGLEERAPVKVYIDLSETRVFSEE